MNGKANNNNTSKKVINDPRAKIDSFFIGLMDTTPTPTNTKKMTKTEEDIQAYCRSNWSCSDKNLIKSYGPLLFFKQNHNEFPSLSRISKAIFSVSSSSTPVESVFSGAKETANSLRNRTLLNQVESLTLLRQNPLK